MYSPYSDLYKMVHTPKFIVLKVSIDNKEYFGRVDTIKNVSHPFSGGDKQSGIFDAYNSMDAYESGTGGNKIEVTAKEIVGLQAIDTVNPKPLNDILSICSELPKNYNEARYNYIKYDVPEILSRLLTSMKEYSEVHNCTKNEEIYEEIEQVINDCKKIDDAITPANLEALLRDTIEKVSIKISNFVEFSGEPG